MACDDSDTPCPDAGCSHNRCASSTLTSAQPHPSPTPSCCARPPLTLPGSAAAVAIKPELFHGAFSDEGPDRPDSRPSVTKPSLTPRVPQHNAQTDPQRLQVTHRHPNSVTKNSRLTVPHHPGLDLVLSFRLPPWQCCWFCSSSSSRRRRCCCCRRSSSSNIISIKTPSLLPIQPSVSTCCPPCRRKTSKPLKTRCANSLRNYTTNFESRRSSRHLFFRKTHMGTILFSRLTSHPLQPADAAASAPVAAAVSAQVSDMDALLEKVKLAFACAKWTFVLRAASLLMLRCDRLISVCTGTAQIVAGACT